MSRMTKARKAHMLEPSVYFRLTCERPFTGVDSMRKDDRRIERAVGRASDGSGCGFGIRDMDWTFHDERAARRAYVKLQSTANLSRVWLNVVDGEGGEEIELLG